jgi:hypothetical protein
MINCRSTRPDRILEGQYTTEIRKIGAADAVKRGVHAAVAEQWGKKPLCLVHVLTI